MKLKFVDRVLLIACAALSLLMGLAIVILSLQSNAYITFTAAEGEGFFTLKRVLTLIAGLLLFLAGGYLLYLPRKLFRDRKGFIVQQTDNGELRIAIKAIDSLIKKCVDMHEEIRLISMNVTNSREGVTIELGISLANNISIPLAVASLQKQIKQYLLASSGIDVCEVRVLVETAENGVGESPYLVNNDIAAATNAQAAAQPTKIKEKLPLHRRIFGKSEQPATEPPAPTPAEIESAAKPEEAPATAGDASETSEAAAVPDDTKDTQTKEGTSDEQ